MIMLPFKLQGAAPKRFEALQSSKTCNAALIHRDQEPDDRQECFDVRHLLGDNAAELGSGDLAIARIAAVRCNRSGVATACYSSKRCLGSNVGQRAIPAVVAHA